MGRTPKFDDEEILDRAMVTFWQHGWSQTSIRDLEQALELKAPSIYRRFGTKSGLGVAVIDHYVDRVVTRRVDKHLVAPSTRRRGRAERIDVGPGDDGADVDDDPIGDIRRFLELSVTQSGDGAALWGCLLTTTSLEAAAPEAELTEALQRGLAVIETGLRNRIERARALGRLATGVDPSSAVAMLTLAMQGLMSLARGGVSSTDLRRRARDTVSIISAS